jgi:hypothetical protein
MQYSWDRAKDDGAKLVRPRQPVEPHTGGHSPVCGFFYAVRI